MYGHYEIILAQGSIHFNMKIDKTLKGSGRSPVFSVRVTPELKEQLEEAARREGVSLGNWLKELGRRELKRQGIDPKG